MQLSISSQISLLCCTLSVVSAFPTVPGINTSRTSHENQLGVRQDSGFSLAAPGSLEGYGLDGTCEQVLYQPIQCDPFVEIFSSEGYRGSLQDAALTDSVCSSGCENSLKTARRRIAGACRSTPELGPGFPVLALVDMIYGGFNETCVLDPFTLEYCNDVIESWSPPSGPSMPQEQLCSHCWGAKLRVMQQSPYSVYNEVWAARLGMVNSECNQQNPTQPTDGGLEFNVIVPPPCQGGLAYITKEGDTCDSIAQANSLSASTLYFINPSIRDCNSIRSETTVCLPDSCERTHSVKEGDTCAKIALDYNTSWLNIIKWNAALNSRCTNLLGSSPSWGSIVCATPPGGAYEGSPGNSTIPGNGGSGGQGGSGDGYSNSIVDPPGEPIAEGTTRQCGNWVQAEADGGCGKLLGRYAVPMDIFISANPSLKSAAECSGNLLVGPWYCLNPWRYFTPTASES